MKTAVIIPVHNRRAVTVACVRHLIADRVPDWADIIVVDDGSTDGTGEAVARELATARVIRGNGELWWTGAIVLGMEAALADGAEILIWLNDDTEPRPGTLQRLRDQAGKTQGIVGGACLIPQTTEVVYGGHRRHDFAFELMPLRPGVLEPCDALSGNLVAMPRAAVEKIGLPDAPHIPHALADLDYTMRARASGIPVQIDHDAVGYAIPNTWANHTSWLFSDVSMAVIWQSLWQKRSYGYLPTQWHFLTRHWGWRGGVRVLWLVAKRVPVTLLRCVTTLQWRRRTWGANSRAWQEEKRLRMALGQQSAGHPIRGA